MEELQYSRMWNQINGIDDGHLDIEFYKDLDFVRNHVMPLEEAKSSNESLAAWIWKIDHTNSFLDFNNA